MLKIGTPIPEFCAEITGGTVIDNQTFQNNLYTVLYFYPRDNTPGCTQEGRDFRAAYDQFKQRSTEVLGISRDTLSSHEKFKTKQEFPFELVADPDETLCQLFDVMRTKNMYGKQVRGIERSTFLIDQQGILIREWRKIKVPGHVDQVLETIKNIQAS